MAPNMLVLKVLHIFNRSGLMSWCIDFWKEPFVGDVLSGCSNSCPRVRVAWRVLKFDSCRIREFENCCLGLLGTGKWHTVSVFFLNRNYQISIQRKVMCVYGKRGCVSLMALEIGPFICYHNNKEPVTVSPPRSDDALVHFCSSFSQKL